MTPLPTKAAEIRAGLVAELRAACVGHPNASIAWPHRVLHQAADLIEQQAAELAEAREESARRLACMDRRADRVIELTDELTKAKAGYGGLLSTWAESRDRHLAAESERDELLREKERLGALLRDNGTPRFNEAMRRAEAAESTISSQSERIAEAVAAEREACAKLVAVVINEMRGSGQSDLRSARARIENAIRARETPAALAPLGEV